MKVCTDACILGAWFAEKIPSYSLVLDIGSGTGLLMMMLAQKNKADIHGIEIDLNSFKQLKENIQHSPWRDKLKVFPGDVRTFAFQNKYDFIIANPPFFENDLQSESEELNIAKHSKSLTLEQLIKVVVTNLTTDGSFGILLPYHRMQFFEELAMKHNLFPVEKLLIKQTKSNEYFRCILQYSLRKNNFVPQLELVIQDDQGKYTPEFTELLKDYYLNLQPA